MTSICLFNGGLRFTVACQPIRSNPQNNYKKRLTLYSLINRHTRTLKYIKYAADTHYQDNNLVFPRMKILDPHKRLGIDPAATEEEVFGSRNFLLHKYAGHETSEESIESAFERLLMDGFHERKKKSFNFKTRMQRQVEESPDWFKKLLSFVDLPLPPPQIIYKRFFLFAFFGFWSILHAAEPAAPAFQVAVSLAACCYFLYKKVKSFGRALFLSFGGLAMAWLCGSVLIPMVPMFLVHPVWTLELATSLLAFFFLFLACTFLK